MINETADGNTIVGTASTFEDGQGIARSALPGGTRVSLDLKPIPGRSRWQFAGPPEPMGGIAIADDQSVLITSRDSGLYSLDPAGNVQWIFDDPQLTGMYD